MSSRDDLQPADSHGGPVHPRLGRRWKGPEPFGLAGLSRAAIAGYPIGMGASHSSEAEQEPLICKLRSLLEGSLGLSIVPRKAREEDEGETRRRWLALSPRPLIAGTQMAAFYLLAFGALPWLWYILSADRLPPSFRPLFALQLYGALWSGWATASTRLASVSVSHIVERIIVPGLGPAAVREVGAALDGSFRRARLLWAAWAIGAAAGASAGYLMAEDLPGPFKPSTAEIVWWSLGWTLLYATAAKVVMTTRFYELFAKALESHPDNLFWPNAASSSVVVGVAAVARRMLFFWLSIAISIALILPFGIYVLDLIDTQLILERRVGFLPKMLELRFVIAHLVGTAFFSIGVGSLVFLRSEARLRAATLTASAAALRVIETQVRKLRDERPLSDRDLERAAGLRSLQAHVASGASYRTLVLSGLSLIIPFVPLLTLILNYLRNPAGG